MLIPILFHLCLFHLFTFERPGQIKDWQSQYKHSFKMYYLILWLFFVERLCHILWSFNVGSCVEVNNFGTRMFNTWSKAGIICKVMISLFKGWDKFSLSVRLWYNENVLVVRSIYLSQTLILFSCRRSVEKKKRSNNQDWIGLEPWTIRFRCMSVNECAI